MRPPLSQTPIRPKVSTMPRAKTEAAAYLDIYKLVTERKRLEQELESLNQRRDRILKRLEVLNQQAEALETVAHQIRDGNLESGTPAPANAPHQPASKPTYSQSSESLFETFDLEY